jgi:integrase
LFFKNISPVLPVDELKPKDVLKHLLIQKADRSGNAANKDCKNLKAAWNWGMKYLDPLLPGPNPFLVERMPEERHPRYVPPEEDFWKVYELSEGQDRIMLLCFLHLAARRGEIFRMTWDDVDFGNSQIRIWTRKRLDGSYESNCGYP